VGCHGSEGQGDGPQATASWPAASNLTELPAAAMEDDYLFFRIAEGGTFFPYNSAMPALGQQLTEEAIWQLVTHVQAF
jgi:mono/diheme cytochrome c family protein